MRDQFCPYTDGLTGAVDVARALALETDAAVYIYHAPRMGGWLISDRRNWQSNAIEVRPDGHLRPFCGLVKAMPT